MLSKQQGSLHVRYAAEAFYFLQLDHACPRALVLDLAERLREDGVDVILDKWDLREGNDAHAFMERMVTDPEIKQVAMICDVAYVDKANRRGGGVGTETQIITGEIYAHTSQDKFVAVIAERDAEGNAVVPAYYKGRIYIDLTDIERYEGECERLVRWVGDKPLYVKPPLGKKPAFLEDVAATTLGNRSAMRRALDQLREGKATATAALGDYLSSVSARFEELRIVKSDNEEFDDQVLRSIEDFLPTRDEALAVIQAVSRYQATSENVRQIHRFFEALLHYYGPRPDVNSYAFMPSFLLFCSEWPPTRWCDRRNSRRIVQGRRNSDPRST